MSVALPSPSIRVSSIRWAHTESDRGLRFAAYVERLVAREADRDRVTGLTPAEARAARCVVPTRRVRVESVHNPLIRPLDRPPAPGATA